MQVVLPPGATNAREDQEDGGGRIGMGRFAFLERRAGQRLWVWYGHARLK